MPSSAAHIAREIGMVTCLDRGAGMAHAGIVTVTGADAASFLHSQTTNDVVALQVGEGHSNARVTRTGHLESLFTAHRLHDTQLALLLPASNAPALVASLDAFLFSEDVTLHDASSDWTWWAVQGPRAADICTAAFGALGFEPWSTLPSGSARGLRRMPFATVEPGIWAFRRSLTGDVGFLIGHPKGHPNRQAVQTALHQAAKEHGLTVTDGAHASDTIDTLRVEAGLPRIGPETAGKRRLLPETGVDQVAVSYTKGCYLGQEVIARVRTYGSVPTLLRALVLDGPAGAPGEPIRLENGDKIGTWASSARSVTLNAPIAMAYLNRTHRAPGQRLQLHGTEATVALLPIYAAPDAASRAAYLYDRGVRVFAAGDESGALQHIEQAIRLDPSFSDGYEAIGVILGRAGKYHEAIDFFRRLEEVAPEEPMVNTNLSLYYMKLGDKVTAEEEAAKSTTKQFAQLARSKGRDWNPADFARQQAEADRADAERKRRMFGKVLDFDPDDAIALYGIGNACFRLDDHETAADMLAKAVQVDPKNSAVWLLRGKVLEKLDKVDEAVEVYRAGVEVASRRGDLMPLKEMEHRLLLLGA